MPQHPAKAFLLPGNLLEHLEEADVVDERGNTILHATIRHPKCTPEILRSLCTSFPQYVNWHNYHGHQPMQDALMIESTALRIPYMEILLDNGADINGRKKGDWVPLMIAAKKGLVEETNFLLGKGAMTLLQNSDGFTAFQLACISDEVTGDDVAMMLLDKDPEAFKIKAFNGRSPLFSAVKHGHMSIVKRISEQTDGYKEEHGLSLLDNAKESRNAEMIALISRITSGLFS